MCPPTRPTKLRAMSSQLASDVCMVWPSWFALLTITAWFPQIVTTLCIWTLFTSQNAVPLVTQAKIQPSSPPRHGFQGKHDQDRIMSGSFHFLSKWPIWKFLNSAYGFEDNGTQSSAILALPWRYQHKGCSSYFMMQALLYRWLVYFLNNRLFCQGFVFKRPVQGVSIKTKPWQKSLLFKKCTCHRYNHACIIK